MAGNIYDLVRGLMDVDPNEPAPAPADPNKRFNFYTATGLAPEYRQNIMETMRREVGAAVNQDEFKRLALESIRRHQMNNSGMDPYYDVNGSYIGPSLMDYRQINSGSY